MTNPNPVAISACCNASTHTQMGDESTNFYVCDACGQPCDLAMWNRAEVNTVTNDELREQAEWESITYPRDKFADVDMAKIIKKILHPKGFETLYPETEDERGNPKIAAIMQLITADREKAIKQAEEITADIEFKAGINYATMSGEYVTKNDLEKAVLDGQIKILNKIEDEQETYSDDFRSDQAVSVKEIRREVTELQNQRKALQ